MGGTIVLGGPKKTDAPTHGQPGTITLFGGSSSKKPIIEDNSNIKEEVNSLNRRVKMIEERYGNLRGKTQLMEQNMLHKNKTFFNETKTINLELTEVKKEITEIKDRMLILLKELDGFAKKEQVDILRKYIDLWNPVHFVTKNDVEAIVRETIEDLRTEIKTRKGK